MARVTVVICLAAEQVAMVRPMKSVRAAGALTQASLVCSMQMTRQIPTHSAPVVKKFSRDGRVCKYIQEDNR